MPTGAFQPGHYAGTTSQGLPISLFVSRAEVGSALFDWRAVCADGKTHRRAILLHGRPIEDGGHFAHVDQSLHTGGLASISGTIAGVTATGALSRRGTNSFGTECVVEDVTWEARWTRDLTELRPIVTGRERLPFPTRSIDEVEFQR